MNYLFKAKIACSSLFAHFELQRTRESNSSNALHSFKSQDCKVLERDCSPILNGGGRVGGRGLFPMNTVNFDPSDL